MMNLTRIRQWHWGKVVILWSWGGAMVALLLALFLPSPADQTPALSTFAFLSSLAMLVLLSATTWIWLGGKEAQTKSSS